MSIAMLERAAQELTPFLDEVAFVGGATIALWITDQAAPERDLCLAPLGSGDEDRPADKNSEYDAFLEEVGQFARGYEALDDVMRLLGSPVAAMPAITASPNEAPAASRSIAGTV